MIQEIVAIVDRSGSMHGKEADTIGGLNTVISELKTNKTSDETIKFSVKFFDDREHVKIRSLNIEHVRPLLITDLNPRGQTALLDAMGNTIKFFIDKKDKDKNAFNSCIIYVATDGFENCSVKYTNSHISDLIQLAKLKNIEILYLGANQDAILEASKFGLDCNNAMNYSETQENTESAYRSLANAAHRQRAGRHIRFTPYERSMSTQINEK